MSARYPTDQVGSLLRPPRLLDARDAYKAGRLSLDDLRQHEDQAILDALAMQRQVGIAIYSDGELRRDAWQTGISQAVEGFVDEYPVVEQPTLDGGTRRVEMHFKAVRGKLRQLRRIAGHEATFLKQHAGGPFKITMVSPSSLVKSSYQPGVTDQAYPSREALHADLVAIVRGELQALAAEGVTYVQLDEGFTTYVRDGWREQVRQAGGDPEALLAADIAADNACYDALPAGQVTRAMHLCRGSRTSASGTSGGYDWLAERLFDALHVDRFLLEYDTERAGGFEPLRFVPRGKTVVLGLVTTKTGAIESQDDLRRRIDEAARYVPLEHLALSPQCGFASTHQGNMLTPDDQWRKLELVVDTARKVWG